MVYFIASLIVIIFVLGGVVFLLKKRCDDLKEDRDKLKALVEMYKENIKKHEQLIRKLRDIKKKREEKVNEIENTDSDDLDSIADLLNGM